MKLNILEHWLDTAICDFVNRVWFYGLLKIVQDANFEKVEIKYFSSSIVVTPGPEPNSSLIEFYDFETQDIPIKVISIILEHGVTALEYYQITQCIDMDQATNHINLIIYLWSHGYYLINHKNKG